MEVLVLGGDPNDRGTQLETLTKTLLEKLGYSDVTRGEIGAGGHEIDVSAVRRTRTLGGEQHVRLVCECKAHRNAVAMPDWLKFLGKVFLRARETREATHGCLIALGGVNGNVAGSYEVVRAPGADVEIVTGTRLQDLLHEHLGHATADEALARVGKLTTRHVVEMRTAYYDGRAIWVVRFSDGTYAVDPKVRETADAPTLKRIDELLAADDLALGRPVDLLAERQAEERRTGVRKILLSTLMVLGGRADVKACMSRWRSACETDAWRDVDELELQAAADSLVQVGLVRDEPGDGGWRLTADDPQSSIETTAETYRALGHGQTLFTLPLGSAWYDEHITDRLVDHACAIQGGIEVGPELRELMQRVLRWSPSALQWSLRPDPMLLGHREAGRPVPERIARLDRDYVSSHLVELLEADFANAGLHSYTFGVRGLREIEVRRRVRLKSERQVEFETDLHRRIGIGRLTPEHGGGLIRLLLASDAPEPWAMMTEPTPIDPKREGPHGLVT